MNTIGSNFSIQNDDIKSNSTRTLQYVKNMGLTNRQVKEKRYRSFGNSSNISAIDFQSCKTLGSFGIDNTLSTTSFKKSNKMKKTVSTSRLDHYYTKNIKSFKNLK